MEVNIFDKNIHYMFVNTSICAKINDHMYIYTNN